MTTVETTITSASAGDDAVQTVRAFLAALQRLDLEAALAMLDEHAVYQNVPLPPDKGVKNIERTLRLMLRFVSQFEVRMHHLAGGDGVVLTERTDILKGPWLDMAFWVCGTFEVRAGKITLWRDYFDPSKFVWQLLSSPVRTLLKAPRTSA